MTGPTAGINANDDINHEGIVMIVWNRRMPRAGSDCFRGAEGLGGHTRMLDGAKLRRHRHRPDLGLRVDQVFAELALSFDDEDEDPGAAGRLVPSC